MSESVFSLGRGRSSAAAWYSTVLDTKETLPNCHVHAFAAGVIKSLNTYVKRMLDCVLGHLVYLLGSGMFFFIEFFAKSRLGLRLAAWAGEGILQVCPLSTVIIIALKLVQSDCTCNRRFCVNPYPRTSLP